MHLNQPCKTASQSRYVIFKVYEGQNSDAKDSWFL